MISVDHVTRFPFFLYYFLAVDVIYSSVSYIFLNNICIFKEVNVKI